MKFYFSSKLFFILVCCFGFFGIASSAQAVACGFFYGINNTNWTKICLSQDAQQDSYTMNTCFSYVTETAGTMEKNNANLETRHYFFANNQDCSGVPDNISAIGPWIDSGGYKLNVNTNNGDGTGFTASDYEVCNDYKASECSKDVRCFLFNNSCYAKIDTSMCSKLPQQYCGDKAYAKDCIWNNDLGFCQNPTQAVVSDQYNRPDGYQGFMPDCAWSGDCRDVNDLLKLAINFTKFLFGFIGSVAFVMFIYGGFTIILSMGNSDKVNQGKQILTAAIVGLIIAFGAYVLVDFILDAFQTSAAFREIGN